MPAAPQIAAARVVLVLRQSPDWQQLAAEHAAGRAIVPARYLPPHAVPAFPDDIPACIAQWNEMFRVDFFACRAELRRIARGTLDAVEAGVVLHRTQLRQGLPAGDYRLFFLDDDDWFAPDTAQRLAGAGQEDVAVFPLLRLDCPVFTFSRRVTPDSPIVGIASPCSHRFQTNNYGLHARLCRVPMLDVLADHIDASAAAGYLGLVDAYHEVMVSVTNKTPAAASVLPLIARDPDAFRSHVERFIAGLRELPLPPHSAWMRGPIDRTADLFARALG